LKTELNLRNKKKSLEISTSKQKFFGLILIVPFSQIYSQPNKIDK